MASSMIASSCSQLSGVHHVARPFCASRSARLQTAQVTTHAAASPGSSACQEFPNRRALLALGAALVAGLPASHAFASSRPELFRRYYDLTDELHSAIHRVLDVDASADDAKTKVATFRKEANEWVGGYRSTMSVGRKSFAETYAAINIIQGHYTTRGPEAPLPTKVRNNAEKKLESAETALKREKAKDAVPKPR